MATLDHMINCARIMNAGFAYRFYLGKAGLATKMKLINNLTLDSFMATIAEALALAEDVGIDKELEIHIKCAGAVLGRFSLTTSSASIRERYRHTLLPAPTTLGMQRLINEQLSHFFA